MLNGQFLHCHRVAITVAVRLTESHGMAVVVLIARRFIRIFKNGVVAFLAAAQERAVGRRWCLATKGASVDDLRRRKGENDSDNHTGQQHDDDSDAGTLLAAVGGKRRASGENEIVAYDSDGKRCNAAPPRSRD